jgi:hypothetical protein
MVVKSAGLIATGVTAKKPQIPQVSNMLQLLAGSLLVFLSFLHDVVTPYFAQQSDFTLCAVVFPIPGQVDKNRIHTICKMAKSFIKSKVGIKINGIVIAITNGKKNLVKNKCPFELAS